MKKTKAEDTLGSMLQQVEIPKELEANAASVVTCVQRIGKLRQELQKEILYLSTLIAPADRPTRDIKVRIKKTKKIAARESEKKPVKKDHNLKDHKGWAHKRGPNDPIAKFKPEAAKIQAQKAGIKRKKGVKYPLVVRASMQRLAKTLFEQHPDASPSAVARMLQISTAQLSRYREMDDIVANGHNKVPAVN